MGPLVLGFIVVFSLLEFSNAQRCPPNEFFSKCDTACPPTCQNRTIIIRCAFDCIPRCTCIAGYIRTGPGGSCVPESCKGIPICNEKDNEEFSTCATGCPRTCNETETEKCPLVCDIGCVCKKGYIRESKGGRCIPDHICPPDLKCRENQLFKKCGSACPPTCENPSQGCDKRCVRGCFCECGYRWSERKRACIKKEECESEECYYE